MDTDMIQLRNTNYYIFINKGTGKSLYFNPYSINTQNQHVTLVLPDQTQLGQVWMLIQIAPGQYPNMYEIVHTLSTYVLTGDRQFMVLKPGKWKTNQFYFPQRHNPKKYPNQFWFRENKQSNRYLIHQNDKLYMKTMVTPNQYCIWQLLLVHNNPIINASCSIQYAYSNMVLDVPKASDKPGTKICQYPCNNRFNQRWNLIKQGQFYRIQNLTTKMSLDIKGMITKPGTYIVQNKATGDGKSQLWDIEYQGKNLYMIRSALDRELLLGVKDNSLKQCADIVTTNDDNQCFWRIVGHIPL